MNITRNDAQLAGRLPQEYKDFIDSLWKDENGNKIEGEDFPSAIKKLIDAYNSKPVESGELDFTDDFNKIKSAISTIEDIITGVKGRATQRITEITAEANERLDKKNAALLEAEDTMKALEDSIEERFNEFKKVNDALNIEISEKNKELVNYEKSMLALDEEVKDRNIEI